ncbi:MAG TPA: 3D domain-containing protein [Gaiellaceae bacterium]|nr:3D domain-containing protein [Gaiellaceae bacterium]
MLSRRLAPALAVAGVLLIPAAGLADDPTTLRARGAELEAAESQARLDLFALQSKLARAESALAGVRQRLAGLERERATSRRQLDAARRTLAAAERRLAEQVRTLYVSEQPDVLAVFLGAGTIEDAIDGVDSIYRAADATNGVLEEAQAARVRVAALLRRQTQRREELRRLTASAVSRSRELVAAAADRRAYISQLQAERLLNEQQIAEAVAAAEAAQSAASVQTAVAETAPSISSIGAQVVSEAPPPPQPSPQAPVAQSGKTLTVVATAYTLRGTTATGIPAGPGVVAVDPTVIPLGTRMTIPGYGEGVAADTGGAIKGLRIDLWVSSPAEAAQWQWQTVTITLH